MKETRTRRSGTEDGAEKTSCNILLHAHDEEIKNGSRLQRNAEHSPPGGQFNDFNLLSHVAPENEKPSKVLLSCARVFH